MYVNFVVLWAEGFVRIRDEKGESLAVGKEKCKKKNGILPVTEQNFIANLFGLHLLI